MLDGNLTNLTSQTRIVFNYVYKLKKYRRTCKKDYIYAFRQFLLKVLFDKIVILNNVMESITAFMGSM